MEYPNIRVGIFLARPNRFIAQVEINGAIENCHVKNTGRCRELLIPGTTVYVQEHDDPKRKTKFSLIGVRKGERLINMDSQAPNSVVEEWLPVSGLFGEITKIQREAAYGNSRFDFYIEADGKRIFAEIKGVTLEENNVVRFPDAPTQRGVKHLRELVECRMQGYDAYVIFVVQMKDVASFSPNEATDPDFAQALRQAKESGVKIVAVDCLVTESRIEIRDRVPVLL